MPSITIVFRKDKLNKKDHAPIHFRIIKNRKISYISSGISIPQDHWDSKNSRIKSKHTNSNRLNSFIVNKLAELQDQVFEHETISKSLTTRQLKHKIYGKPPSNFFEFSKTVLEGYEKRQMFGTHDKSKSIVNKIEMFHGSRNLMLQDITQEFLEKYDSYCRKKFENKTNTIFKDMKFIRKVFSDAVRLDIVEVQQNPFLRYKLKTERTQRAYLTEEELEEFANVECIKGSRLELHRDMFVFAAYTGGLRVSDVLKLKWKNIGNTHINLTMKKTGSQISIKLPDRAIEIIEKYRPTKVIKDHYIFQMLPNGLNENDIRLIDREISGAGNGLIFYNIK